MINVAVGIWVQVDGVKSDGVRDRLSWPGVRKAALIGC